MRKPRKLKSGAIYHVTAKINLNEFIFAEDKNKDIFEKVVKEAKKKFKFVLINSVIMSNHIHLMIKPNSSIASLSKIMQWILSVFAIRFNNEYKRKGHVWYDRFRSNIINSFLHYIRAFLYIANNPVKAGLANDIFSYKYSGIYHLMRKKYKLIDKPPQWLKIIFPFLPK